MFFPWRKRLRCLQTRTRQCSLPLREAQDTQDRGFPMKSILNFGGGVNSTAMYFVLRERKMPIDAIIFADTGAELPETYSTVQKFEEIAKADGVPFITIKSKLGNIYEITCDVAGSCFL